MGSARREGERVAFYERYVLNCNGRSFDCILENFSTTGILVRCDQAVSQQQLHPGDYCTIMLSAAPPKEVRCRVARQDHNHLGLEFAK